MSKNYPWASAFNIDVNSITHWQSQSGDKNVLEWAIENGKIPELKYLTWAKDYYNIPAIGQSFFEKSPDPSLWEKWAGADWEPSFFPVYEWQGTLYVACIEPPSSEQVDALQKLNFKFNLLLAPLSSMGSWWSILNPVGWSQSYELPPELLQFEVGQEKGRIANQGIAKNVALDTPVVSSDENIAQNVLPSGGGIPEPSNTDEKDNVELSSDPQEPLLDLAQQAAVELELKSVEVDLEIESPYIDQEVLHVEKVNQHTGNIELQNIHEDLEDEGFVEEAHDATQMVSLDSLKIDDEEVPPLMPSVPQGEELIGKPVVESVDASNNSYQKDNLQHTNVGIVTEDKVDINVPSEVAHSTIQTDFELGKNNGQDQESYDPMSLLQAEEEATDQKKPDLEIKEELVVDMSGPAGLDFSNIGMDTSSFNLPAEESDTPADLNIDQDLQKSFIPEGLELDSADIVPPPIKMENRDSTIDFVPEELKNGFNEMSKIFEKQAFYKIEGDRASLVAQQGEWVKNSEVNTTIDLTHASIFRVVHFSKRPYHGYVARNTINDSFFLALNKGKYPRHCSVAPVYEGDELVGMLVGCTDKESKEISLERVMEIAQDVAIQAGSNTHQMAA
ncbi:MAG: hypothetical protein AB8E15_08665 [Bdellovibrionales bacterium]